MFLIKYIGAVFYDALIALALCFTLTGIFVLCNHNTAITPYTHWYQSALLGLVIGYYTKSLVSGGQTLGMKAWQLTLRSTNSQPLSIAQVLKRFLYFTPAIMLAPLYFTSPFRLLTQWTNTTLSTPAARNK